ncbi:MAG: S4 domain-containing protein [Candidatus Woesearchaeota archaeon]
MLRKERKWVTKPAPGKHPLAFSIPLDFALKKIGLAKTSREVKRILTLSEVLVDGRRVREPKTCLGLMDLLTITPLSKSFLVVLDSKGLLKVEELPGIENKKVCKIVGKIITKGGKIQLQLSDGRVVSQPAGTSYSVGDSLVLSLPEQGIVDHLPLKKGAQILLIGGKRIGQRAVVEDVKEKSVIFKDAAGRAIEVPKKVAFVLK